MVILLVDHLGWCAASLDSLLCPRNVSSSSPASEGGQVTQGERGRTVDSAHRAHGQEYCANGALELYTTFSVACSGTDGKSISYRVQSQGRILLIQSC
jgi:hypothetical protein